MIDAVLEEFKRSSFDFRKFANPDDPLARLFPEWIPYYRLKFAIAKVLQPRSILEIGVRYGYSARTFLEASRSARLLGIDLDCDRFGGQVGALHWARRITEGYNVEYLIADSQEMKRFPGGIYDFIHVDGQQDGIGSFHDLRRAVSQARWVLLGGYFWTRPNSFNTTDFLFKFKDVIDYAITIPGYAGELLIRVSDQYLHTLGATASLGADLSTEVAAFYDANYYLNDCGGIETFRQSEGKHVGDVRLLSLLALSELAAKGPAIDLGCGRGEITYQLALSGREVTAVDYSKASIELAKACFRDQTQNVRDRVDFICGDVSRLALTKQFNLALAGDLIEHLSEEELNRLIQTVANLLGDQGILVIHTFPNRWYYEKYYPRLQASAKRLGAFLPAEPRSRYELLMHINEQSPADLRRSLRKRFRHVAVWVGDSHSPATSLLQKCSVSDLIKAPDIYALASHGPLDLERAKALLTQRAVSQNSRPLIRLSVNEWPEKVGAGSTFYLPVRVANRSKESVSSMPPFPVNISYHWFAPGTARAAVVWDGLRTTIPFPLAPGAECEILAVVEAPSLAGPHELNVILVQEGCSWFDDSLKPGGATRSISVR